MLQVPLALRECLGRLGLLASWAQTDIAFLERRAGLDRQEPLDRLARPATQELRDRWGVQAPKAFLERPAALDRLPAPLALLARKGRWETRGSKVLPVFKAASERPEQLAPSEARALAAQDRPA